MSTHLSCPVCGQDAALGEPTTGRSVYGDNGAFCHTATGRPLCPTPGSLYAPPPSWPDDHRPGHPGAVHADTVAIAANYPCRLWGHPRPGERSSPVVDRQGPIDCAATIGAHGCPHHLWLAGRNTAGLAAGGGCWLRAAPAQAVLLQAYASGIALPYRLPGFTRPRQGPRRAIALSAWFANYRTRLPGEQPDEATAQLDYVVGWLRFAAYLGGGIRTTRIGLHAASAITGRRG